MPHYDIECKHCKYETTFVGRHADAVEARCEVCGRRMYVLIGGDTTVQFKGRGWSGDNYHKPKGST
jgi:putative FmdB family regulatory protein